MLAATAAVVLLLPIWAFPYFLTQDGPTHVENAKILLDYDKPGAEALHAFYVLNLQPFPNWFSHLALSGLMLVATPLLAEKLLLSAYVLLLPVAFRYALGAIRPEARPLWPLVLPFVYSHLFHCGFYNLAFAAVLFFVVLGYWAKRRGELRAGAAMGLATLLLFLYFCHLVTLLLALGALGVLAVWLGALDLRAGGRARWMPAAGRVVALCAASLPAVILALHFMAGQATARSEGGPTLGERWSELWRLSELASHSPQERWLTATLGVLLLAAGALLLVRRRESRRPAAWDGFLAVTAALALVYFLAPVAVLNSPGSTPGGGSTHDRVAPYVFLSLLLWIASQDVGPRIGRGLVASSAAVAVGLLVLRIPRYAEMNEHLAEYLQSAPVIAPGATLLPLSFAHQGRRNDGQNVSWRVAVFLHAGAWLAVQRDLVDFTNYEADLGYFPTLFRPEANPYRWLRRGLETSPPCIDLPRYERRGRRPLDYVLLWERAATDPQDPCVAAILEHLEERYERVHVSEPQGRAELFHRRATARP